jgi:hypothetical protein
LIVVVLLGATVALSPDDASAAEPLVQPTFFTSFKSIGIGGYEVATGDVNGDGNLDLTATNQIPDTVSLLLGHGDGTFSDAVDYATGDMPLHVTFGDLNGDGNDDVITGDTGSPKGLSVLLANGDGTLGPRTAYPISSPLAAVISGDVNADGHVDVLVATFITGGVSLLLGNGDGTLDAPTPVWTVAGGSRSVLLADVNGDTLLDLLTVDQSPGRVEVLLGDGAGGFSPHGFISSVTQAAGPRSLAVADFNGDGHVDVVVATGFSDAMRLALGNGDGSFGMPSTFGGGGVDPFSVAAGDLNGDGIPDLAIADWINPARGLLGNGDGTFTPWNPVVGSSVSALMADFNHDGVDDVAISTRNSPQEVPDAVGVLINTTNLQLARPVAACGDGSATVSWTAPVGASIVTGYVVTAYHNYWANPTITFNSPATTQTITGLRNGLEYGFQVVALTAGYPGPASKTSNHVIPATSTAPGAPTIGSATPGNTAATVSWTAPASDGCSPITGYVVTPYVGYFPLPPTTFNSTATTQTITGLTNGTTYRFRVQAINAVGASGYSKVTNPVTPTA